METKPVARPVLPPRFTSSGGIARFIYAAVLIALLAYGLYVVIKPLVFLDGYGDVKANSREITAPYLSKIVHVHVRPGQKVLQGSVLVVVARADEEEVTRSLTLRLHNSTLKLNELKERFLVARDSHKAAVERVTATEQRLRKMQQPQYSDQLTAIHLANLQGEHAQAVRLYAAIAAELKLLPEAIKEVEAESLWVTKELDEIRGTWGHVVVPAHFDGIVGAKIRDVGSTVPPGQSLLTLYDSASKYILWRLPEFALRMPEQGDAVTIMLGNKTFTGSVRSVLPVALAGGRDPDRTARLVEVEVEKTDVGLPIGAEVMVRLRNF
jgi:multidrug resistance efflux pump